ncbi:MAG: tyrosine-type recombinase/integrase [Muribaculaceae bacterium]|nr:tyrosine-type recombinase/integrase [Muribaculaceae bacterium]
MKQEFPTERKFHFNLRKPKGVQATPIYFVVSIGGKQYKLSTNVKVNPRHWDNTRQVAVISNTNTRLDNKNNRIVNERLEQIKGYYMDFICYLCNQEETPANIVEVLKTYIYKDMAKKKTLTIDVIKTIREAFNYYYTVIHQNKESSVLNAGKQLNRFISYIEEKNLNNSVEVFSQTGLNAYKAYLIDLMNKEEKIGKSHINTLCQLIARLINDVLIVNDEYLQYKFSRVEYKKIEDKRQQDEIKRFLLYDEEIQAIKDCKTLTEKEQEYRTIFLLQCASGQRISDILQVIKGNYDEKDGVITLQTIKKGTYSQIYITDEIKGYLEEVKQIKLVNLNKFDDNLYNKALKNICQKAGLNRQYKWKDSRGKEQINPIWEIIVSHCARHTFATNKVKEGVPVDIICNMT